MKNYVKEINSDKPLSLDALKGEGGTSRYDELEEINNPDFVSKSFRSSSDAKARKQKKAVEIEDINELHIAPQPPPDISVTSLEEKKKRTHLHENFLKEDQTQRKMRWIKRLYSLRQRALRDEPAMEIG